MTSRGDQVDNLSTTGLGNNQVAFGTPDAVAFTAPEVFDVTPEQPSGPSGQPAPPLPFPDSRLFLGGIFQSGLTPQVVYTIPWAVEDGYPVGTDLALNVDTETIEILTTGVYAFTCLGGFDTFGTGQQGTTGNAVFSTFMNQLTGTSFGNLSGFLTAQVQSPGSVALPSSADMSFGWTGRCDAGDTFNFSSQMAGTTNAAQWRQEGDPNTLLYIVRLA